MSSKIFYIYLDKTDDGRIFYVGKGYLKRTQDFENRNQYWKFIANKYGVAREVILATKDEKFAFEIEIYLIAKFKTCETMWQPGEGWGCNFTIGGEGRSGSVASLETRKKLSEFQKGEKHWLFGKGPQAHPMFGKFHSKETKEKMSKAHAGEKSFYYGKKGKLHPLYGRKPSEKCKLASYEATSGENNYCSKLTHESVIEIRHKYTTGNYTHQKLAEEYKVSRTNITTILSFKSWKNT